MLLPNFSRRRLLIFRVVNASLYALIWILQVLAGQWTTIMWLLTALVIAIGGTMTWQWQRAPRLEWDLHLVFLIYAIFFLLFPQIRNIVEPLERMGVILSMIAVSLPTGQPLRFHWLGRYEDPDTSVNLVGGRWLLGVGVALTLMGIMSGN